MTSAARARLFFGLKALGCALFAVYLISLLIEPSKEDRVGSRFARSSEPETSGKGAAKVLARGWIDTNRLDSAEKLRLWITFENHTGDRIENLHFVQFNAPGLQTPDCWFQNTCMQGAQPQAAPSALPATLEMGQSATVWAALTPSVSHGRYSIVAVFSWSGPKGESYRDEISLGPVEITSWWRDAALDIGKPLATLIQGLALPAVLILLGWYFQRKDKEREEARHVRDNEEEERRETRKALLPGLLEHTQRYYMPINRSIKNILGAAKEACAGGPADKRQFVYWVLLCCRRFRALREDLGGFHFKDRTGETVAVLAWTAFNYHVEKTFGLKRKDLALDLLQSNESFAKFEDRFDNWGSGALFHGLETDSTRWLQAGAPNNFATVEPVLTVLTCVLSYEMNRPFAYWYDEKEHFMINECEAALTKLPAEPADTIGKLKAKLDVYLKTFKPPIA